MRLHLQFSAFMLVGVAAMVVHYGLLIGLVQLAQVAPVPATLVGYVGGGLVSYALSRAHVFSTERNHADALWRFVAVAGVGFLLTWAFMHLFVDRFGAPYIPAQIVTTGIVMFWSFAGHKFWTFGERAGR
ncbi:MAG: GtrA family protein [Rhodoblastus sp.]|nr:GtrA family protein [Rhodoblastus sp.]